MLIFQYDFLCLLTVCFILVDLFLESSEHALLWFRRIFLRCLNRCLLFFRLIVFLELGGEFADEALELITVVTWFLFGGRWWCGDWVLILYFVNNLGYLTIWKVLLIRFGSCRFRLFLMYRWFLYFRLTLWLFLRLTRDLCRLLFLSFFFFLFL